MLDIQNPPAIIQSIGEESSPLSPVMLPNQEKILDFARTHLPQSGTLLQKDGTLYLDLPNEYIEELFPLLDESDLSMPPYFDFPHDFGAHVTVVESSETRLMRHIEEIDQEIHFTLRSIEKVKPLGWEEMQTVYFVTIESKELEEIRSKLGLSPKLNGHDFHITIGVKKAPYQIRSSQKYFDMMKG